MFGGNNVCRKETVLSGLKYEHLEGAKAWGKYIIIILRIAFIFQPVDLEL
jgi:hypothetical protein